MKVSVVILNWNTCSLLQQFLPIVVKNSGMPNVRVVVADNGSTDQSVAWVRTNHPEVDVIELGQNLGFAGGYNQALSMIDSDFCLLLNSDAAPGSNWLPPLIATMEQNPKAAACVPAINDYNKPDCFEYAGAAGGFIDKYGYTFCRGRIFNKAEEDSGQYHKAGSVFWGSGAALMVRTHLFVASGGFDTDFFAHMEEIDWCWRVKNQGYQILFVPNSRVFHLGGGTLSYQSPNKTYLNFRNNLFLILKNQPGYSAYIILVLRFVLDFLAMLNYSAHKEWRNVLAVSRAHRQFILQMRKFVRKRNQLMPKVIQRHHVETYNGSVVWDFFARGKTKFSQLHFFPDKCD
jgi:GT2 family glycosyltransferase